MTITRGVSPWQRPGGISTTLKVQLKLIKRCRNISCPEICKELGGFLPHDYSGLAGGVGLSDDWHWVGHGADDIQCWACRPSRWSQGVRAFPCDTNLSFGCERRRAFPLPLPSRRPKVYRERLPGRRLRPGRRHRLGLPGRAGGSVLRRNPYLNILL